MEVPTISGLVLIAYAAITVSIAVFKPRANGEWASFRHYIKLFGEERGTAIFLITFAIICVGHWHRHDSIRFSWAGQTKI